MINIDNKFLVFVIYTFALYCCCFDTVTGLPTIYKYNENRILEPDLIPVSSTVIPLPVYQVSHGIDVVGGGGKADKIKKPDGPITLLTVHNRGTLNKKKPTVVQTKFNKMHDPSLIVKN